MLNVLAFVAAVIFFAVITTAYIIIVCDMDMNKKWSDLFKGRRRDDD